MTLKRLYFSKFSWGACLRIPLRFSHLWRESGKFVSAPSPPPKFLSPYAYEGQDLIMRIQIYLKYRFTYENAEFCILGLDDFKILKILNKLSTPRKVTGANPPPPTLQRPYDVSRGQNRYVTLPFILLGKVGVN